MPLDAPVTMILLPAMFLEPLLQRSLNRIGDLLPSCAPIRRLQQLVAGDSPTIPVIDEAQGLQLVGSGGGEQPVIASIAGAVELSTRRIRCPGMRGIDHVGIVCLNRGRTRLEPVHATIV